MSIISSSDDLDLAHSSGMASAAATTQYALAPSNDDGLDVDLDDESETNAQEPRSQRAGSELALWHILAAFIGGFTCAAIIFVFLRPPVYPYPGLHSISTPVVNVAFSEKESAAGGRRSPPWLAHPIDPTPPLASLPSRHIAISFFGQAKNLELTLPSLRQYIFEPLRRANFTFDIFAHTYAQSTLTTTRNRETEAHISPESIALLRDEGAPLHVEFDPPTIVDALRPMSFYMPNGKSPWPGDSPDTMRNFIRQLHSLDRVTTMWEAQARVGSRPYEYVVYLRPDVVFYTDFILTPLPDHAIGTPDFHRWGGFNDRFAYGRPEDMRIYGHRVRYVPDFFARRPDATLHAERYLMHALQDNGLTSDATCTIRFARLRAHGSIAPLDESIRDEALRAQTKTGPH